MVDDENRRRGLLGRRSHARSWLPVKPRRILATAGSFTILVLRALIAHDIPRLAASLAYTSLLALVPLIAIALAILAAFPGFGDERERMIAWIIETFVPYRRTEILDQVEHFVGAAAGLTALGVAGLTLTAIILLLTIESSLNAIFRVEKSRHPLARLLVYWSVLTGGPLLMGLSFSLSSYLVAIRHLVGTDVMSPFDALTPTLGPPLLSLTAMTLLYMLVPNRPVPLFHALAGALVATIASALLRSAFLMVITRGLSYETLYGALAALPAFLVWMYLSWAVVLMGAVTAAEIPNWKMARRLTRAGQDERAGRLRIAVEIMVAAARVYGEGTRDSATRHALIALTATPDRRQAGVLRDLDKAGLLIRDEDGAVLPGRDPRRITLAEILHALTLAPPTGTVGGPGWADLLRHALETAGGDYDRALGLSLDALVQAEPLGARI
ncbi:hypothetical protein CKO38_07425 [Rhodospirillum rubrum]|uniref:YihY family inner membrane protein n=1 Tax=Rhodospirillum rubrum TaxID=1085 RepID=UPI0019044504|nr:YihY family inner membrane protein [Rhodospirillum rubrum]MBK1665315.1 hypothetical protein [Rhodospirillum rubrum]MBK1676503.1 hypothetical protein [Rhodospirillum rubrum]